MKYAELIKNLESMKNARNIEGMARFGISSKGTLGVAVPKLRSIAKSVGNDQELSLRLWRSAIHEARILAALT